MKPLLFGSALQSDLNADWESRFGCKAAGGRIIDASIGWHKSANVKLQLAQDRAEGRVSIVWMHKTAPKMKEPGFVVDDLVNDTDTLAYTALLKDHAKKGGLAVVDLMDELEQYAKWGPAMYRATYDAIAARFPVGVFPCWSKGPFVGPKVFGGPLKFADWRPNLAMLRGAHLHGDNVFPDTEKGADTARFFDETADLGFAGVAILDGGFTGKTPPLGSPLDTPFIGDVRNPDDSVPQLVATLKILEEQQAVFSVAPHNQVNWGTALATDGFPIWRPGRFVPGKHSPQDPDQSGDIWAGCPEYCDVLAKYIALPRVLHLGNPVLKVGLQGWAAAMGVQVGGVTPVLTP